LLQSITIVRLEQFPVRLIRNPRQLYSDLNHPGECEQDADDIHDSGSIAAESRYVTQILQSMPINRSKLAMLH
jgi:hypothetical protein